MAPLAPKFDGRFRTVTIRNVDKRPYPGFVKAYSQRVSCWPAPEVPRNLNATCCDLHLNDQQEDDLVAFLRTLSDGFVTPNTPPENAP
jgi:cytochrome c peroxidase